MYYPLIRSKQYELLAFRESIKKWNHSGSVIPIVEPVNNNTRDLKLFSKALFKESASFIIIDNPSVGKNKLDTGLISDLVDICKVENPLVQIAHIVTENTTQKEIDNFTNQTPNHKLHLIFRSLPKAAINYPGIIKNYIFIESKTLSKTSIKNFQSSSKIIILDGFKKKPRNADYPPQEPFESHLKDYKQNEFIGFGDFSIVGDNYSEGGGGNLITVAIHITQETNSNGKFLINHFLSEKREVEVKRDLLIKESLASLTAFLLVNPDIVKYSTACQEYLMLQAKGSTTSLGFFKKLSIRHHTETIINSKSMM